MTNRVILKRPKEKVKSDYADLVAITKSQKLVSTKIFKPKFSQPISLVRKLLPKAIALISFFFSSIPEDDYIKDNVIVYGYGYKLGGISSLNKEKRIKFDRKDDKICDITKPTYSQEPIFTKTWFQVESFYKIPIFLLVQQCFDRLPQLKVQFI